MIRLIVLVVLLLLAGVFVALNWSAFTTPFELNFLFTTIVAPLGLLMLGFIGALIIVFVLYAGSLRTSALVETRRYSKELEAAHKVTNEVEESRINALQETVLSEMAALRETMASEADATRTQLGETQNVLTAHLAQIDDFIKGDADGPIVGESGGDPESETGSRSGTGSSALGGSSSTGEGDDEDRSDRSSADAGAQG